LGVNLPQFSLKAGDRHEFIRVEIFITMTGVILCGGQSTRIDKDKGLLMAGRFTWAEKMAVLLRPIFTT
jgi:hypothetical protein